MARCVATTHRGHRCRNDALVDEPVCTVHYRLREEEATDTPKGEATAGADGPPLGAEQDPEPPPGAAGGALEGLELDPGPDASAEARDRVEIDPELFRGLEDAEKAEKAAEGPSSPSPPPPPRRGALLASNPGPWNPGTLEGVILPPLNRRFVHDGVPELGGAEADAFLEALAATLNRIASRVDPNNPYAALALSSSVMLGTRYVPRMLRGKPSENGERPNRRGGPKEPDPAPRGGETDSELEDGREPTWADELAPTL